MSTCCRLEICCDPPRAEASLADFLRESLAKIRSVEDVAHLLLAEYRLIPRGLNDDPVFRETLDREIRTYLQNQGIPTEKEA
jgi:hypothetical protein